VWVTATRLHFHYWGCPPTQRYVTAVMANDKDGKASRRWRDRGAATLRWKGGYCYQDERPTPEHYVKAWSQVPAGRDGILIDEFGGGSEVDQRMGRALVELRRRRPDLAIVPYCVGLKGEDMIAGFRASDLCLPECYAGDWRSYGVFRRWKAVAKHGLAHKTVAALGIGHKWATTEAEIRQQFAYLRSTCPEMPGMSFFPRVPPRLSGAIDRAIEDYFLRPVILLDWKRGATTTTVRNIGQMNAEGIAVLCHRGEKASRLSIAKLPAGQSKTLRVPTGTETVRVGAARERHTVVRYEPPTRRPLPDAAARARASAYLARLERGPTVELFAKEPRLRLVLSKDKKDRANYSGNVEAATLPLGEHAGQPLAVSVEVEVGRCWFYGTIGLELRGGDASLGFHLAHHDHDRDIHGSSPRLMAWFQDASKDRIHGTMPPGLVRGKRYTVLLSHEGDGAARVMVWEKGSRLLWDSGPWRTAGDAHFDTLRFTVRPFRHSAIRWEKETRRLFLRGVSGGPLPSPYRLEGWFSNLRLHLAEKGPKK
jgi:hypothetical protein